MTAGETPTLVVPGLGPYERARAVGGRLLVRDATGRVRPLLAESLFFDVADPCVSWDGTRVLFAATTHPDSAWRIHVVGVDGRGLAAVTRTDRRLDLRGFEVPVHERYDDLDPCWLPDGRICFASTRFPLLDQHDGLPVTNLFVTDSKGHPPVRITTERSGAEEPSVDPTTGRLVYSRWWFNRHRPTHDGITTDPKDALPAEEVDLWHAVSIQPDGDGIRLAGGDPRVRLDTMAQEPIVTSDGTLIGVWAQIPSFSPGPGALGIQAFPGGIAKAERLAGPGTQNPFSACSPAVLPDGRLLFSYDREGTGDLGIFVMTFDDRAPALVLDLPGTLELDAVVLAARPRPPVLAPGFVDPPPDLPFTRLEELVAANHTFRFDCLNVFATGPVGSPFPDAPPLQRGVRIRFFAALPRPTAAGGDTVVLLREASVTPSGAVHEHDLPADVPLFEQLVDSTGAVLLSSSGPAHVPGFNFARLGSGTKCIGCHTGHSALPVPGSYSKARWFNASPSADVTVSSLGLGTPRALVDRRVEGPLEETSWIAEGFRSEWARLAWNTPIEVRALVLYALRNDRPSGTDLQLRSTAIRFFREGHEIDRLVVHQSLLPSGTRIDLEPLRVDTIEIRPGHVSGTVGHRKAAALAEIETEARLPED